MGSQWNRRAYLILRGAYISSFEAQPEVPVSGGLFKLATCCAVGIRSIDNLLELMQNVCRHHLLDPQGI